MNWCSLNDSGSVSAVSFEIWVNDFAQISPVGPNARVMVPNMPSTFSTTVRSSAVGPGSGDEAWL